MSSRIRTIYLLRYYPSVRYVKQYCVPGGRRSRHALLVLVLIATFAVSVGLTVPGTGPTDDAVEPPYVRLPGLAAGTPNVSLTYNSLWNSTEQPVRSGDRIEGDHIVLYSRWTPAALVESCRIEVNATAVPTVISAENESAVVSIDTRRLGYNFTCTINMTAILTNGSVIYTVVDDVFLGNFFVPHVVVVSPNGGERWTGVNNITWIAWDNNTLEELTFDVLLSKDGGQTFETLAEEVSELWYTWNCTEYPQLDTYVVKIRVSDGIYWSEDVSDQPFTAGEVPPSTTTTTTTETTPTTATDTTTEPTTTTTTETTGTTFAGPAMFFLAAVMITASVFAIAAYYTAKQIT